MSAGRAGGPARRAGDGAPGDSARRDGAVRPAGTPPPVVADVVVVAAGAGRRMGAGDKLALEIAGRPILAWTLDAVAAAPGVRRVVVVTAPERVAGLRSAPWLPGCVVAVVPGGPRRQDSVAAGVAALGDGAPGDVVLVHDGARPLVSPDLVRRVAAAAALHGAAIPVVPLAETLKRIEGDVVAATEDRSSLATAQTPQGIRRDVLARAWTQLPPDGPSTWTDEASLLEACRIAVQAVPGETTNLKMTVPDDLRRLEAALAAGGRVPASAQPAPVGGQAATGVSVGAAAGAAVVGAVGGDLRVGIGEDGHPFGPGGPLALGGIAIAGAPRLHGHSDGDVVLHAVCDALLGGAGLGDLGRLFPAGPATPAGIASEHLLRSCLARVAEAGFVPMSADVTIVGARPRLGGRLPEIAARLGELLQLPPASVNVKASTGNLLGPEGAGRAISARAAVVLRAEARGPRS